MCGKLISRKDLLRPVGKYEIIMGFLCNENCRFCSIGYAIANKSKFISLDEIKRRIDNAAKVGANEISFTGGEPTIVRYLIDAIKYAKNTYDFEQIEIQSNGIMFSYKDFTKKIIDAGANRFLISIHSHKESVHDYLTQVRGSWKKTVSGIYNLKEYYDSGTIKELRTNTVVTKINYKNLPNTMDWLYNFDLYAYHLSPVIIDGNALVNLNEIVPRYSDIIPYINKSIEIGEKKGKEIYVYSLLPCNIPDHIKNISDLMYNDSLDTILSAPGFDSSIWKNKYKHRIKSQKCVKCKYYKICPGPWKRYVKYFGDEEFVPIE